MIGTNAKTQQLRDLIPQDVFDYQYLTSILQGYEKPRDKIKSLVDGGDIVRIRKGLYVFNKAMRHQPLSRELLANLIYGPSYISCEYALSYYQIIPEAAHTVTSVSTGRSRSYETPVGNFTYSQLNQKRYPVGVTLQESAKIPFLIATPEKALVDRVWIDKRITGISQKECESFLLEDLRIDTETITTFNHNLLEEIDRAYSSRKVRTLVATLKKMARNQNA